MKKIFLTLTTVAITTLVLAQNQKDVSLISNASFKESSSANDVPGKKTDGANVNTRAIMHFNGNYKNVADVQWSVSQGGYMAFFSKKGNVNRVFYDKNGNWKFSINYYGETKLDKEIRNQIKSVYYDFTIKSVQEINLGNKTVYMIYIESDNSSKQLWLCDGEMEVANDFENLN